MKRTIFSLIWIFLCFHTSISFTPANAATEDDIMAAIESMIQNINASGSVLDQAASSGEIQKTLQTGSLLDQTGTVLNSAPTIPVQKIWTQAPQTVFTDWELVHRTPMLAGFTWSGEVANFITPAMYIGTPIKTNASVIGYDTTLGPTNYTECVRAEMDASFGVDGVMLENTPEDELRNIAKYCATEFLGSYFTGKSYTTREEMLMLFFTIFDEDIGLPGYFDGQKFISDGRGVETPFHNVSAGSWFAPYLARAAEYTMISITPDWRIAQEASDTDIESMLTGYLDGADTIETTHGTYIFGWDNNGLSIQKQ